MSNNTKGIMTLIQALQLLDHAAASAVLTRQDHVNVQHAIKLLDAEINKAEYQRIEAEKHEPSTCS